MIFFPLVLLPLGICSALGFYEIRPVPPALAAAPVMFFDLDGTLYESSLLNTNTRSLAVQYLMERKGLSMSEATRLLTHYRAKYSGMVIQGLAREQGLDAMEYENYIDARTDLFRKLTRDQRLYEMLARMNTRLYVFTNAGLNHAVMALKALGILDRFHGIVYIDYGKPMFRTKPDLQVYQEAMNIVRARDPSMVYFLDNDLAYAAGGKNVGWNSIFLDRLQRSRTSLDPGIPSIRSVYELPIALPNLFLR